MEAHDATCRLPTTPGPLFPKVDGGTRLNRIRPLRQSGPRRTAAARTASQCEAGQAQRARGQPRASAGPGAAEWDYTAVMCWPQPSGGVGPKAGGVVQPQLSQLQRDWG